jgi:hypothetical protein
MKAKDIINDPSDLVLDGLVDSDLCIQRKVYPEQTGFCLIGLLFGQLIRMATCDSIYYKLKTQNNFTR